MSLDVVGSGLFLFCLHWPFAKFDYVGLNCAWLNLGSNLSKQY